MTRLIIPQLRGIYDRLEPLAYAVLRVLAGGMMIQIALGKVLAGEVSRDVELMQQLGLVPAALWAYFVVGVEIFASLALILGLLTRPAAVMLFILVTVMLLTVLIPRGANYQLGALWFGAFGLIALRGGGRYSIDRLIGREF
ncbi:DoxX family protein [Paracoccus sp. 11-3]|uniref:DoxX family protein n=1 Tax=Paracoccus amoyensis TaxID=2760093 RepID=A0A926GAI1_9RHOB|nr:DoxX family protein [Paracoccus amoyensis]MBC9247458.1 DoxX family protein [Paracoccus amoyensis]